MRKMRVLVISDTHGRLSGFSSVLEQVQPDLVLHAGDIEGQEREISHMIQNAVPDKACAFYAVRGNCDFSSPLPLKQTVDFCGHRILLVHGHLHQNKLTDALLAEDARADGCDIAVCGHTHVPKLSWENGIRIVNPGSFSLPRQEGRRVSYAVGSTDGRGLIDFRICFL